MSITLTTSQEFFKLGILFHICVLLTFPVYPCMSFLLPFHQCVKVLHHILCNFQAFLYAITWPKICPFSSSCLFQLPDHRLILDLNKVISSISISLLPPQERENSLTIALFQYTPHRGSVFFIVCSVRAGASYVYQLPL